MTIQLQLAHPDSCVLIWSVSAENRVSKIITLKALIRLEAAAFGEALDVPSFGLEVMVLVRTLWEVKASKVGAL
jgi:hypothetical protein